MSSTATPATVTAEAPIRFWFGTTDLTAAPAAEVRAHWFQRSDPFDQAIRAQFENTIDQALDGRLDHWRESLTGQLALILLCDQFTRNIFRGSARAFAGDALALEISQSMIRANTHGRLGLHQRAFAGMPLEHCELAEVQDQSVAYFAQLKQDYAEDTSGVSHADTQAAGGYHRFALAHREVIRQFGRYPHRNAALGRETTPDEQDWLDNGGGF